jgi:hypothetical protein
MIRPRTLTLESLEDRLTPTTSGVTWPDGSHLTLSFVPDGTQVGVYKSNLFQTLGAAGPTAAWQQAILRAVETWSSQSNLNVGVVADGGQPLGTSGAVQGDPRFGDIRIAAAPFGGNTLITNTQFQWSGTSWSGDIVVNSAYQFNLDGSGGKYDLYTCMLNEMGNVFGVLDSHTDTAAGVYYKYVGVKTGIDANDVADIQSLYGTRSPDQYDDAAGNNGTLGTATNLGLALTGLALQADISSPADVDYYKFLSPTTILPIIGITVQLNTSGLSTLAGSLGVYNAAGHLVGSATATDPLNGDLTVQVSGGGGLLGLGGLSYSIRVGDGNNPTFGVGAYNLTVSIQLSNGSILSTLLPSGLLGAVGHTLAAATQLPSQLLNGQKPDARFDYTAKATINSGTTADYYKVKAPSAVGQKMNVLVWALPGSSLLPRVDVYDANGNSLPATVLANENGSFSVEWDTVPAGSSYYIKVSALNPHGTGNTGSYFLGVDFTTEPPTVLTTFDSGSLTSASPQSSLSLSVDRNQLYEFILSSAAASSANVEMDIYDASGALVFTLQSTAGSPPSTGHVYLKTGTYTVRFTGTAPGGGALPTTAFSLTGQIISDPIGPQQDTGIIVNPPGMSDVTTINDSAPGSDQPYYA